MGPRCHHGAEVSWTTAFPTPSPGCGRSLPPHCRPYPSPEALQAAVQPKTAQARRTPRRRRLLRQAPSPRPRLRGARSTPGRSGRSPRVAEQSQTEPLGAGIREAIRTVRAGRMSPALAMMLRGLERDGLVRRTVCPTKPPGVEQALTGPGREMVVPGRALGTWVADDLHRFEATRLAFDAARDEQRLSARSHPGSCPDDQGQDAAYPRRQPEPSKTRARRLPPACFRQSTRDGPNDAQRGSPDAA